MNQAVVLVLLLLLVSCIRTQESGITFAVGGAPAEFELWEGLIKEFELRTAIRVNLLKQPTDTDHGRKSRMCLSWSPRA